MGKRCIVPPQVDLHKHRCEFCKTISTCPGVACRKTKYRTCYTCNTPEKVKFRAEQKRQEILAERQSGYQLYIFESRVGVAGLPPPAWFQGFTFSYTPASTSGTYPLLHMPTISWDGKDYVEKMNMTPTPPFIMHSCDCANETYTYPWDHLPSCKFYKAEIANQDELVPGWVSYKISYKVQLGKPTGQPMLVPKLPKGLYEV